jgi:glycosyltransferase involved in cell wall biosynthesis
MKDQPLCSIVIPTLNEEKNIQQCLLHLNNQSYPRELYQIVVVDNGSSDSTLLLANELADIVLELPKGNVGAVRNFGISNSNGEIVICTDADCVVGKDWIKNGVNLLSSHPKSVFGGGLKPGDDASWIERGWLLNDSGKNIQQNDLMGSCIFLWKNDFVSMGGFNENITSGEDSELSSKLKLNNFSVILSPKLSLVHLGNPKSIVGFIKRQIWHSENYSRNFTASFKDKIFLLTLFFMGSLILSIGILFFNPDLWETTILTQVSPIILSIKRLRRSSVFPDRLAIIFQVLLIDNLYLVGRSIGLLKGIFINRSGYHSS